MESKSKVNYRGKMKTIKIYLMSRDDRNALLDAHNDIIVPMAGEVVRVCSAVIYLRRSEMRRKMMMITMMQMPSMALERTHLRTIVQRYLTLACKVIKALSHGSMGRSAYRWNQH